MTVPRLCAATTMCGDLVERSVTFDRNCACTYSRSWRSPMYRTMSMIGLSARQTSQLAARASAARTRATRAPAPNSRHPGPMFHVVPSWSRMVNFRLAAVLMNPRPKAVTARLARIIGSVPSTYVGNHSNWNTAVRSAHWSGSDVAIHVSAVSAATSGRSDCDRRLSAARPAGSVSPSRSGGSGGNQYELHGSPTRIGGTGVVNRLAPYATSHQMAMSIQSATRAVTMDQPARIARSLHGAAVPSSTPIHEAVQNAWPSAVMSA